jgi:hypothetical protein
MHQVEALVLPPFAFRICTDDRIRGWIPFNTIQGPMLHPSVVAWRHILTNYIKATVLLALEDLLIWNHGPAIWRDWAKVIRKSNEETPGPGLLILLTTKQQQQQQRQRQQLKDT